MPDRAVVDDDDYAHLTDDQLMERVRASRDILNRTRVGDNPDNHLRAFFALFHSEKDKAYVEQFIRDTHA